jgi:hypothetical protein
LRRRFLGGVLVAVIAAIAGAPHNHSIDELVGGGSSAAGERAVTTHDPHSRASHWHAVIRFVKEDPCLACQWQRLPGACPPAQLAPPTLPVWFAGETAVLRAGRGPLALPSSRAPPSLL